MFKEEITFGTSETAIFIVLPSENVVTQRERKRDQLRAMDDLRIWALKVFTVRNKFIARFVIEDAADRVAVELKKLRV